MKTSTTKSILAVLLTFVLANPSPSTACECIVSGETKLATIEFSGETHCYWFWAEAGQGVVIEMADLSVSVHDSNSLAGLEPRVQVYDPNGVRIADSGWDYSRATIDNCPLVMTGIYTIVVSDTDASGGYGVYWRENIPDIGEYGLSLVLTGGTTTSLNDRDGGDMTVGRTQSGIIASGGDLDVSIIYGRVGQGITIEMVDRSASGVLEPRVRFYGPDGVLVADSGWDNSRATIENYQLMMSGIYTIVTSDADASGGYGVYWREYTPDTGEYGLSVAVMPPKDPYGLYPYYPLPPDGNSVSLCDWDTLSWWPVDGATSYDVYFAGSQCMPLEKVAENIVDPWMLMPVLEQQGQVCYWRVVAHTPAGDIQGSTWWFSVEPCGCSLMISAIGQGSIVDPNEGFYEYPCGEVVPVTAVADPNYEFVRWEGTAVDANKVVIEYQDPTGSQVSVTVDDVYTLTAVFEEIIYGSSLDSDPGWTMEGQWEFGIPAGQQCGPYGYPDPNSSHTGQNVIGVNLNGCYNTDLGGPYSVVAGPFELKGYKDVKLSFWRWLNTDWAEYVESSFEVSPDGNTWDRIWQNPERDEITDSEWTYVEYYYPGSWPDNEPIVYLRWSYQIVKERANAYTGWNIDDIQLCGKRL